MKLRKRTKRFISVITLALLLVMQVGPVWALTAPAAPTAPEAPSAPENTSEAPPAPEAPTAPEAPPSPSAPEAPSAPDSPQPPASQQITSQSEQTVHDEDDDEEDERPRRQGESQADTPAGDAGITGAASGSSAGTAGSQSSGNQTGGQNDNGNLGDTTITTGNATNTATIATNANSNLASSCATCGSGGATVVNSGNGDGSTNTGSVTINNDSTTNQDNTAVVTNNLTQESNTGGNSASRNTGGNSSITTGDANTTATLITAVNTNVDAVAVAEFNVVDDHVGDIVLDFAANCISGCGPTSSATAVNSGNGSDSTNNASIEQITNNTTFQNNDATVENTMTLESNTGGNSASRNTGGDSSITTGDANVSASALTFANNNLAGDVYYYVVNIFGDLVGDIIFPEELLAYGVCCGGDLTAINSGNGDGSTNTAEISLANNNTTTQTNIANIQNNLVLDASTGGNSTSRNTNGGNSIETGNANIDAQVLNVVNSNVAGGTWWLVLINEAGQWIGKLFGGNAGNYAGSAGTEFTMNEAGEITAVNSGNGSGSTNTIDISQETNNTLVQNNTANVTNNLNLSANTGGNSASRNTGGNSSISTGDANIITNLVNFVNNNIAGGGKLFVTAVNVFGSWIGDFLPPGFAKENDDPAGIGGPESGDESSNQDENGSEDSESENSDEESEESEPAGDIGEAAASVISQFAGYSLPQLTGEEDGQGQVLAGDQTATQEEAANKVININLAWLLVLIPAALLLALLKKRLALLKG